MNEMIDGMGDRIDGWDDLLLDEAGVDEAQATALEVARNALRGAPELSLTIRPVVGGPRTRAATSERARALDEWQYEHGEGPCVEADARLDACVVTDLRGDGSFPRFGEEAMHCGIRGVASFPLLVREERSVGSLNLFYEAAGAIDDEVVDRGLQLAATLAPMLANFLTHQRALDLSEQLEEALEGRSVIERAKGLLMERMGIDDEAAFELLSVQSQHENRKVRSIAAAIVEHHERSVSRNRRVRSDGSVNQ